MKLAAATALAVSAGLLHTASFAPLEWWWLQIAATAMLVAALWDAAPRRAAWLGWVFGLAWLASGFWWIYNSLHRYGGMAAWLSALSVLLLAAALALYYALAAALWARWRGSAATLSGAARAAFGFAACWLLAELARGSWFTGFPWIAGGYAHTTGPYAGWAPYIGIYGIGALTAGSAAALAGAALLMRSRVRGAWMLLLAPALLVAAGLVLPQDYTRSTGPLGVTLLQSNVPQDQKFDLRRVGAMLRWHADQLARAHGPFVLTPEGSIPLLQQQIDPETWRVFREPFLTPGRGALVGLFTGDEQHGYRNSVLGLSATSDAAKPDAYMYAKRHLLPFGEFIPPGFRWFVDLLQIPLGDQQHGTTDAPFEVAGQRVRPLICYEDLFGEDLVGSMTGDAPATVFANVSNLAWFGPLMMQDQHLQFSRMRALEFQRPLVRATNTGATAAIDHRGHVFARLAPEVEGVLDVTVDGRIGVTPYARWLSAAGLWPLWALGAAALVLLARRRPVAADRAA